MPKDIAVIGFAGRFPEAKNVEEYFDNLKRGKDSLRQVSLERILSTAIAADKEYQVAGFLEDIDKFDYEFFHIPLGEAQLIDPHQRIMLEVAYETFERAGYPHLKLKGTNTAVILADSHQNYYELAKTFDPSLVSGNLNANIAGRIARFFGLVGNAVMVDTACSSSLVAVHMSCRELQSGDADYVLTGGISLNIFPYSPNTNDDLDYFAHDGKCKTFSSLADGTGTGEAVGCLLLKRFEDAVKDGDTIHAIIKGSAVNQDAHRSTNLSSPSSLAQCEVIVKAWQNSAIDPRTIGYVEAHGTGTKLGDPIEIEGLDLAFKKFTDKRQFCAVSSVKTNIGHANGAAGIAGFIKVLLSLKEKVLFPSLHFNAPNPYIDFINSAVFVNTRFKTWRTEGAPLRAGISSFSLNGTNCHMVLEEYVAPDNNAPKSTGALVTVSGDSLESFEANIQALLDFAGENQALSIDDMSYTLNVCRSHFKYRAAFLADSVETLKDRLAMTERSAEIKNADLPWMYFPNDFEIEQPWVEHLRSEYPLFDNAYARCEQVLHPARWNRNAGVFAFQYSYYRLLQGLHIGSKKVLGVGLGQLVINVLKDKITLEEALSTHCQKQFLDTSEDELTGKFERFLREKTGEKDRFLLVVGAFHPTVAAIHAVCSQHSSLEVLPLTHANGDLQLLEILRKGYLHNFDIDWQHAYNKAKTKKIPLPTYFFRSSHCWFDKVEKPFAEWMHQLEWVEQELKPGKQNQGRIFLVFKSDGDDDPLLSLLESVNICIAVKPATSFVKEDAQHYGLPLTASPADIDFIKAEILNDFGSLDGIIFVAPSREDRFAFEELYTHLVFVPHFIIKSFRELLLLKDFMLCFITFNSIHHERAALVNPLQSALHGLAKSLVADFPDLQARSIDLAVEDDVESRQRTIELEIDSMDSTSPLLYRGNSRLAPNFIASCAEGAPAPFSTIIGPGSVVVIAGGANGIGLEIAKDLLATGHVNLILLGRSSVSETDLRERLGEERIDRNRGKVLYHRINIADKDRLSALLSNVQAEFGKIHAVFHLAGLPPGLTPAGAHSRASIANETEAKMMGTINLFSILQHHPPELFILFSSLLAYTGVPGGTCYGASNFFLESYVHTIRKKIRNAKVIAWPAWSQTGLWKQIKQKYKNPSSAKRAIHTQFGLRILKYVLGTDISSVVISEGQSLAATSVEPLQNAVPEASVRPAEMNGHWSDVENQVVSIWAEVLKSENLDLEANFFELGGHSVLGVKIVNRINTLYRVEIAFKDILKYPTIRALCEYLDPLVKKNQPSKNARIVPAPKAAAYDLSYAQKRVWIACQDEALSVAYNMPYACRMDKAFDQGYFSAALENLLQRHEILRTTFTLVDGIPKQIPHERIHVSDILSVKDFSAFDDPTTACANAMEEEARTSFDLVRGPLLKVMFFKMDDGEYTMLFIIHHIICDGLSINNIMAEVLGDYAHISQGIFRTREQLSVQYKDYAHWEITTTKALHQTQAHRYFKATFGSLEQPLPLKTDFKRSAENFFSGKIHTVRFTARQSEKLDNFAHEKGVSVFTILLSAVKVLLYRYSGQTDITVGIPVSNRDHIALENQVGYYLNLVPCRTNFDETQSFNDLLPVVHSNFSKAFGFRNVPFDYVVETVKETSGVSLERLINVYVVMQQNEKSISLSALTDGVIKESLERIHVSSKTDLTFDFRKDGAEMMLSLEYNTSLFFIKSIEDFCDSFFNLLNEILDNPERQVMEFCHREPGWDKAIDPLSYQPRFNL